MNPADVGRLDQAEHVGEVLLPVLGHAGVDDDRLLRPDHHRVQRDDDRRGALALVVVDQERLRRDLGGCEVGLRELHAGPSQVVILCTRRETGVL
jgi:hypothetical protein